MNKRLSLSQSHRRDVGVHRRNRGWMSRQGVGRDLHSRITTAVFVVLLALVTGTVISVGPSNSMRRLMQSYDNAMQFVTDVTSPPGKSAKRA